MGQYSSERPRGGKWPKCSRKTGVDFREGSRHSTPPTALRFCFATLWLGIAAGTFCAAGTACAPAATSPALEATKGGTCVVGENDIATFRSFGYVEIPLRDAAATAIAQQTFWEEQLTLVTDAVEPFRDKPTPPRLAWEYDADWFGSTPLMTRQDYERKISAYNQETQCVAEKLYASIFASEGVKLGVEVQGFKQKHPQLEPLERLQSRLNVQLANEQVDEEGVSPHLDSAAFGPKTPLRRISAVSVVFGTPGTALQFSSKDSREADMNLGNLVDRVSEEETSLSAPYPGINLGKRAMAFRKGFEASRWTYAQNLGVPLYFLADRHHATPLRRHLRLAIASFFGAASGQTCPAQSAAATH